MKGFWANEWDLFMKDLDSFADFLTQPVYFGGRKTEALNPTIGEVAEKAETSGFWKRQWELCKKDCKDVAEFLTQPVDITFGGKTIL